MAFREPDKWATLYLINFDQPDFALFQTFLRLSMFALLFILWCGSSIYINDFPPKSDMYIRFNIKRILYLTHIHIAEYCNVVPDLGRATDVSSGKMSHMLPIFG